MSAEDEVSDTQTETTEEVDKTEEVEATTTEVETEDKPQFTEFEKKQFERAKLAEAEVKKLKAELASKTKPQTSQKQDGELAPKDLYALMEAKVPQQDVDEVIKAAKLLGKSVTEALQDDLVKTRLSQLAEFRKSAEVTSSGASKRTTTKVTDEMLIEKSEKGDDVDPEALAEARMNQRKKK